MNIIAMKKIKIRPCDEHINIASATVLLLKAKSKDSNINTNRKKSKYFLT